MVRCGLHLVTSLLHGEARRYDVDTLDRYDSRTIHSHYTPAK